jgi:hypothetical protein
MRMDHYGRLVDILTELWEELEAPDLVGDARPVQKALEKAMAAAVAAENARRDRATVSPASAPAFERRAA